MKEYGYLRVSGGLLLRCRQSGIVIADKLSSHVSSMNNVTYFPIRSKPLNESDFGNLKRIGNVLEKPPVYAHISIQNKYFCVLLQEK